MIDLVLAAALLLRDPPGDAVGAGDLVPPSGAQYRNIGSFDLLELQVLDAPTLALTIEMGALPNPAGLANGFSNAVIDVYIDLGDGGEEALLPGPSMRMPPGRGWEIALRITGDGATAHRSDGDPETAGPAVSYPVRVDVEDRIITVETPFERPEIDGVYALTGVYDPFAATGWRPLADVSSPWAFASSSQRRPVVDVLAPDAVAQAEAIRNGVLSVPRNRAAGAMWVLLMVLGIVVAGVGLVLRRMVPFERGATIPATDAGDGSRPQSREGDRPTARAAEPSTPPALVSLPIFLPALPPPRSDAVRGSGHEDTGHEGTGHEGSEPEDEECRGSDREGSEPADSDREKTERAGSGHAGAGRGEESASDAVDASDPGGWMNEEDGDVAADGWPGADGFEAFASERGEESDAPTGSVANEPDDAPRADEPGEATTEPLRGGAQRAADDPEERAPEAMHDDSTVGQLPDDGYDEDAETARPRRAGTTDDRRDPT